MKVYYLRNFYKKGITQVIMKDHIKNVIYAKVYALGQSIKDIILTLIHLENRKIEV